MVKYLLNNDDTVKLRRCSCFIYAPDFVGYYKKMVGYGVGLNGVIKLGKDFDLERLEVGDDDYDLFSEVMIKTLLNFYTSPGVEVFYDIRGKQVHIEFKYYDFFFCIYVGKLAKISILHKNVFVALVLNKSKVMEVLTYASI